MGSIREINRSVLMVIAALAFLSLTAVTCFAEGPAMKIAPKGKKKITIGVIDPNAGIEVAAQFNKKHRAEAARRGWDIRFVDLKDNIPQAARTWRI